MSPDMPIVDCHCHAGPGDGLSGPWDSDARLRDYVRQADSAGIERTVLFPVFHSDYLHANRAVARIVAANPERFYGFAFVHAERDRGRIGELIALRVEGRAGPQVAIVRWFRNTLKGSSLEFGCEILSDNPEAAAAAAESAADGEKRAPVVVFPVPPRADAEGSLPQVVIAAGVFGVDQGMALTRGKETGFAVLTKLVEQGPGFEIYDYAPVS